MTYGWADGFHFHFLYILLEMWSVQCPDVSAASPTLSTHRSTLDTVGYYSVTH